MIDISEMSLGNNRVVDGRTIYKKKKKLEATGTGQ